MLCLSDAGVAATIQACRTIPGAHVLIITTNTHCWIYMEFNELKHALYNYSGAGCVIRRMYTALSRWMDLVPIVPLTILGLMEVKIWKNCGD